MAGLDFKSGLLALCLLLGIKHTVLQLLELLPRFLCLNVCVKVFSFPSCVTFTHQNTIFSGDKVMADFSLISIPGMILEQCLKKTLCTDRCDPQDHLQRKTPLIDFMKTKANA